MRRCRWCQRWVSRDQPRTWMSVRGYSLAGVHCWRAYVQTLCPECRDSWTPRPWLRPVQPREPVTDLDLRRTP